MNYRIYPPEEIVEAVIDLPVSKSMEARRLVIDFIAGTSPAIGAEQCHDLTVLAAALSCFEGRIDLMGSGTALRLLTAVAAATEGTDVVLDGNESLRRRPMNTEVTALRQLGADIEYVGEDGFAPLHIRGRKLSGGSLPIDPTRSSQFVSALMLIAPLLEGGLRLRLEGEPVSTPYLRLTAEMMRRRGVNVDFDRYDIDIEPGHYIADSTGLRELDWSAASYWYEIAALTAGWIILPGLHADDLQGDRVLVELMPRLGVLTDFETIDDDDQPIDGAALSATPDLFGRLDADLADYPDLAPALAVTAAALSVPFRLTGLQNLRHKETDRIAALCDELLKLGIPAEVEGDSVLSWDGRRMPIAEAPVINPHGDHRMAMAFAPLAAFLPGLVIEDAEVVDKSYPGFWSDLQKAGFVVEPLEESDR